jgi:hypothetical protein
MHRSSPPPILLADDLLLLSSVLDIKLSPGRDKLLYRQQAAYERSNPNSTPHLSHVQDNLRQNL